MTWVCLMKCWVDTPNTDPPPQIHRKCHTLHAGPLFGALVKLAGVCPDWIRNALFVKKEKRKERGEKKEKR